jgi:hypothetical protein
MTLVIWAPDLLWQAMHGWPQLAMSAALHRENSSPGAHLSSVPDQLVVVGLLVTPLIVAGFVRLWRTAELRFLTVADRHAAQYVRAARV